MTYVDSGAEIEGCYRYRLWRMWDAALPVAAFVMLNPSTADEFHDDPTIRRCVAFARTWGFGRIEIVNLYALRATNPRELMIFREPGPSGDPKNRLTIESVAAASDRVIVAWGSAVSGFLTRIGGSVRAREMVRKIAGWCDVYALGENADGQPKHPLYVPSSAKPVVYRAHAGMEV